MEIDSTTDEYEKYVVSAISLIFLNLDKENFKSLSLEDDFFEVSKLNTSKFSQILKQIQENEPKSSSETLKLKITPLYVKNYKNRISYVRV